MSQGASAIRNLSNEIKVLNKFGYEASGGFSRKALKSLPSDYKALCFTASVGFISLELDFVHHFTAAGS